MAKSFKVKAKAEKKEQVAPPTEVIDLRKTKKVVEIEKISAPTSTSAFSNTHKKPGRVKERILGLRGKNKK